MSNIKNGLYIMSDLKNQKTEIMVKATEKTITFELIGNEPKYSSGCIAEFIYNTANKKRTIKRVNSVHTIEFWDDKRFTLYPYRSGIPYLFELKEEK